MIAAEDQSKLFSLDTETSSNRCEVRARRYRKCYVWGIPLIVLLKAIHLRRIVYYPRSRFTKKPIDSSSSNNIAKINEDPVGVLTARGRLAHCKRALWRNPVLACIYTLDWKLISIDYVDCCERMLFVVVFHLIPLE